MNLILKAAKFAHMAHAGQVRKYTGDPYIYHPMRVAGRVMLLPGATEEMVCAAICHDTIEDCNVTVNDLTEQFGPVVASLVVELTNTSKQYPELNRAQRKQMDRDHIATISANAKRIKMLDRIDNLREMMGSPRSFHVKYLTESRALLEVVKDADKLLANELDDLIDKQHEHLAHVPCEYGCE